jgi:hypothetical protein
MTTGVVATINKFISPFDPINQWLGRAKTRGRPSHDPNLERKAHFPVGARANFMSISCLGGVSIAEQDRNRVHPP